LLLHRAAVLSTISVSHSGYPFGSVVPYTYDESARFLIYVSRLAEHYKNLSEDGRASLLVADSFRDDPQAEARATILLEFKPIPEAAVRDRSEKYFRRFPASPALALVHDFVFFEGAPEAVRWIGGFGEIVWLKAEELARTEFDSVAANGFSAVEHMNTEHTDALRTIARAHSKLDPSSAQMISVDRRGIELLVRSGDTQTRIRIEFPTPLINESELRAAIISLLERSESALRK